MRLIDADELRIKPDFIYYGVCGTPVIRCEDLARIINDMPTIEPQKWILCSERLPDSDDFVVVTVLDEHGDTPYRYSDFGWYFDRADCWIIDAEQRTDVIAWMPLPEPYQKEET